MANIVGSQPIDWGSIPHRSTLFNGSEGSLPPFCLCFSIIEPLNNSTCVYWALESPGACKALAYAEVVRIHLGALPPSIGKRVEIYPWVEPEKSYYGRCRTRCERVLKTRVR